MDGIPPEDLKEHERQKTGAKSESDDDEPASKRTKNEGISIYISYAVQNANWIYRIIFVGQNAAQKANMMSQMVI